MSRLPPLNAIKAFEATARRLSITGAAEELKVTPGAVSRQVKLLEEDLDLQLLVRGHRQITLTKEGQLFYEAASKAINELREVCSKFRRNRSRQRQRLTIRAYTTFAMKWLIPKLSDFHDRHPKIQVNLTTSLEEVNFRTEEIDGAIRLGDGRWPDVVAHKLVNNVLIPVAGPDLLKQRDLSSVEDLADHTLLHSAARPNDWAFWLGRYAPRLNIDARDGMTYQSSAMAYIAASQAQGVAIAQRFLVEDDLATGRLVAPLELEHDMGDYTYYLLVPSHRKEEAAMVAFRSWLLGQLGNEPA